MNVGDEDKINLPQFLKDRARSQAAALDLLRDAAKALTLMTVCENPNCKICATKKRIEEFLK
jgi:lipoate synthase